MKRKTTHINVHCTKNKPHCQLVLSLIVKIRFILIPALPSNSLHVYVVVVVCVCLCVSVCGGVVVGLDEITHSTGSLFQSAILHWK